MNMIITDISILCFLGRLDLLESFTGMQYMFHTSYLVLHDYDNGRQADCTMKNIDKYLRSGKITSHEFKYTDILAVYEKKAGVSSADCSAYLLYCKLGFNLLTGDRTLKVFSDQLGIKVHDIIWALDEMLKKGIIDMIEYKEKLNELRGLSTRLPVDEIDRRLK